MHIESNRPKLWLTGYPRPQPGYHKYDRGCVFVHGGPREHTGAARLSAEAALRIGAGVVAMVCDEASLPIYATTCSAAIMTKIASDQHGWRTLLEDKRYNVVLTGPGNHDHERVRHVTLDALAARKNMVIDADAINCFSLSPGTLFAAIQSAVILTPHEGEFARLFPNIESAQASSREERALKAAQISNTVIVLKGNETVIAAPDGRIVRQPPATPWLATAGSGDVLAGICAGLLAQGMDAFDAACAGVWLHAEAGRSFGPLLTSNDLEIQLPAVMRCILE